LPVVKTEGGGGRKMVASAEAMRDPADIPPAAGLTHAEAERRLRADGPNALPSRESHGLLALTVQVIREPMFLLLIGAAAIYLALGDIREALVLAASIVVVIAITVVQERRTERALEALRDLSSPRALVIRDGAEVRIAGRDVVRGDALVLREGDRVAADARLLEAHDLQVDESLLTGESVPVAKPLVETGGETLAFSGTLVVRGTALGEVVATGARSELGRIGGMLAGVETTKTSLERETAAIVRYIAGFALALCVLVAALYYALRGDALAGVLAGLTLAMALLPEEFPVVLTVFLALGAWRIAKHGVLTRRLSAIEMLGAATVLCCDKTGTLTENRMTVMETWRHGRWRERSAWDDADAFLLQTAALASEPRPFDPMERAFLDAAGHGNTLSPDMPAGGDALEWRHPLSKAFLAVCHGWRLADGSRMAALKGAPETVLPLCTLDEEARAEAMSAAGEAAARGLRLIAVARQDRHAGRWPDAPAEFAFRFLGFAALADPVRATVPGAIALCRRAGIRVVMITGDHPETARAIAAEAGIDASRAMTGPALEAMDDARLAQAVRATQVFARVRPEQKLRLVEALRAAGDVVAMTGDGVNDAPALKAAHIGIAMGKRGTDVAREAAALVLLDDDFTSIVSTVRLGRRIHDNIRNAMRYLLAVHVPMAGMSIIPLLAGWPLFAFPVHVVFLEFVIDPACSIVFEAERSDPGVMDRPPRRPGERLFNARAVALGLGLGAGVLVAVAAVFGASLAGGVPEGEARALAFATLVLGNLGLIFANRSDHLTTVQLMGHRNPALAWIFLGTLAALAATLYIPAIAGVFRFLPPEPGLLLGAGAAGLASVAWYDGFKVLRRA
jgi:Ca2+-transporting ATPase